MAASPLARARRLLRLSRIRPAPEPVASTATAVAIIMDGNGRWARRRGLPLLAGHRAGTRALRRTGGAAWARGVGALAVYAFSTENWTRPPDEVSGLLELFADTIHREFPDLARQ